MREVEIFKQFDEQIMPEIKVASKRFAPTVTSEISENANGVSYEISGSPYLITLIDGRPPTSPNAKKGNPTLQEILLEWIKEKGIIPRPLENGELPTLESLSWAMANSMHKKGDLLYQRGGKNNPFDVVITQSRLDNLLNLFSNDLLIEVDNAVIKDFKFE